MRWVATLPLVFACTPAPASIPPAFLDAALSSSASEDAANGDASVAVVDAAVSRDAGPLLGYEDVARQWNAALNAKDEVALGRLYGASVVYYGVTSDRMATVAKVMAALAKRPTFSQAITLHGEARFTLDNKHVVEFEKRGAGQKVEAYLVIDDWTRTILEESDVPTDDALVASKVCKTYMDTVTIVANVAHATAPGEDWWALDLEQPICILRGSMGSGGIDWLPPSTRVKSLETGPHLRGVGSRRTLTGHVSAWGHHGMMRFDPSGP